MNLGWMEDLVQFFWTTFLNDLYILCILSESGALCQFFLISQPCFPVSAGFYSRDVSCCVSIVSLHLLSVVSVTALRVCRVVMYF